MPDWLSILIFIGGLTIFLMSIVYARAVWKFRQANKKMFREMKEKIKKLKEGNDNKKK